MPGTRPAAPGCCPRAAPVPARTTHQHLSAPARPLLQIGELLELAPEAARQLLLPADVDPAHPEHGCGAAMDGGEAWHEAMYRTVAATTTSIVDMIKAAIKESHLLVLHPGQRIVQSSTLVLIQGSLVAPPAGSAMGGADTASPPVITADISIRAGKRGGGGGFGRTSLEHPAMRNAPPGAFRGGDGGVAPARGAFGGDGYARQSGTYGRPSAMFVASQNEQHVAPSVMVSGAAADVVGQMMLGTIV